MKLDSKIPEGPLSQTNTVQTHTGRRWVIGAICLFTLLVSGCLLMQGCYKCEEPPGTYAYIYKFHEGADYSNYQSVAYYNPETDHMLSYPPVTGYRPIPLHNGYYVGGNLKLTDGGEYTVSHTVYLSFTLDDVQNGDVPDDWMENYYSYIIDDNPFAEFYEWDENVNLPFPPIQGCDNYPDGRCIDTVLINTLIDNGELSHYLKRIK